jgi:hypothetical protein
MFTFLLEDHKERVVRKYRLKLVVVYIGLSCALFATGVVFSLPSFAALHAKRSVALLEEASSVALGADKTIADEVKILKEEISLAKKASAQTPVASTLNKILSRQYGSIVISNMSIKRGEETITITIEGKATSRDALVSFSKSLQGEPSFTKVDLPVSSLAKSKNIPWTIIITSAL